MNIIITGASRGIGYQLVKHFAAIGANNIVAISRNTKSLEQLKYECESTTNSQIQIIKADFAQPSVVAAIPAAIQQLVGVPDILINNAGFLVNKPLSEITDADEQESFQVNVFSVFSLIRGLLPIMTATSTNKHIVNISSMGGVQGSLKFSGLAAYSASKGALAVLTECIAEELKNTSIAVNCLALGAVQTEMLHNAFPDYSAPTTAKQMAKYIADFAVNGNELFNGKILPVSSTTP